MNGLAKWAWIAVIGSAGCTAITGTDGFDERSDPLLCGNDLASGVVDMALDLTDMNAHADNLVVADLVQLGGSVARRQVGRVIYDPLGAADLTMTLPCSVTDGNHDVDIVADLNNDRLPMPCIDDPTTPGLECVDHQWRLRLQADGTLSYQHDVDFTNVVGDLATPRGGMLTGLPISARFANMERFANASMEVHVRRLEGDATRETILVYRRGSIPEGSGILMVDPLLMQNLVMRGERFKIAIWIDTNGNDIYDTPSAVRDDRDYATVIDALAEPVDGVHVVFDGAAPPPIADVQF